MNKIKNTGMKEMLLSILDEMEKDIPTNSGTDKEANKEVDKEANKEMNKEMNKEETGKEKINNENNKGNEEGDDEEDEEDYDILERCPEGEEIKKESVTLGLIDPVDMINKKKTGEEMQKSMDKIDEKDNIDEKKVADVNDEKSKEEELDINKEEGEEFDLPEGVTKIKILKNKIIIS